MGFTANVTLSALVQQVLIGLSRTTILFIVSSGLSLVLGVLRIPNIAHGSLYMIGAFFNLYRCDIFRPKYFGILVGPDCRPPRGGAAQLDL